MKHHALAIIPLLLAPLSGVVANGGEYPPIGSDPDSEPSTEATLDATLSVPDVSATLPLFDIRTAPLASTRTRPNKYAWHRAGEAPGTFRKEVERRRKANKAAAKARKKNRK